MEMALCTLAAFVGMVAFEIAKSWLSDKRRQRESVGFMNNDNGVRNFKRGV